MTSFNGYLFDLPIFTYAHNFRLVDFKLSFIDVSFYLLMLSIRQKKTSSCCKECFKSVTRPMLSEQKKSSTLTAVAYSKIAAHVTRDTIFSLVNVGFCLIPFKLVSFRSVQI